MTCVRINKLNNEYYINYELIFKLQMCEDEMYVKNHGL